MQLRIHRFIPYTNAEGPGKRACVWVQGCPIHCKGCGVPWTWSFKGGTLVSIDDVFDWIMESKATHDIEGVTFLGGEPFEQAEALAHLGQKIKQTKLSIMTFSGYYREQLDTMNKKGTDELLNVTDLFIDGPFIQEQLDTSRPWVGSANQRYHFLTDTYRHLEANIEQMPNRLEISLSQEGTIQVNGMATPEQLEKLLKGL
ncbi:radical SAM protein [Salipaludibacillus sp. LMS25]|jgi:anaerobic ribonucleoside-triphosphate reductase activating protein|uniref:4Fe-4S single cluster domain-containing protein n=1 Tax=Salipaludibacillus sp. LMS25 TaxID=2924031 RepID=UPI0020D05FBE|nr:4Fe-4S single cluster domain-containing protein [Salipaludibacillus sp. LMS25]UTR13183.1 radical SAM protein [Salipaludibacillus sp. LMS25]